MTSEVRPRKSTRNFGEDPKILNADAPNQAQQRGIWAKRLSEIRERGGFATATDLAKAAGVSDQNVRNWEAGRAGLSPLQARELARILRCDWRDLYGDPDWLGPSRAAPYALHYNGPVPFNPPAEYRVWQHFGESLRGRGIESGDLIGVASEIPTRDGAIALATVAEVGTTEQRTFFAVRAGRYLVDQRIDGATGEPIPVEGPGIAIRGTAKILFRQDI